MPVTENVREFLTFSKGVISEAPPTAFPEDTALDSDNLILNRDGSVQRRNGLDYEVGGALLDLSLHESVFETQAITTHKWENVGGDPTKNFVAVQVGFTIHFFDLMVDAPSASLVDSVTLPELRGGYPARMATINGTLVIVNGNTEPYLLEYDTDSGTFSSKQFNIQVRDIWGTVSTESSVAIDEGHRPTTLDDSHKYNLYNQGFPSEDSLVYVGGDGAGKYKDDVLRHTFEQIGVYPSNRDSYALSSGTNVDESPVEIDGFSARKMENLHLGNSPAVRGHFIIDAFKRSASRQTESSIITELDYDYGNVSAVVSMAGRLFYSAGSNSPSSPQKDDLLKVSPRTKNTVFFSRIIRNTDELGKCYQEADPTSIDDPQLLVDDGGTITITDAGKILKLDVVGNSCVVIAENGVWEIRGGESGFKATDFYVRKVTNSGAINADSIVNTEGTILYWSVAGIYALSGEPVSGNTQAQNLSETTIHTKYLSIPSVGRSYARGYYDEIGRTVRWLYNDSATYDGTVNLYNYNRELVFDLALSAFTFNSFGVLPSGPQVAGYIPTVPFSISDQTFNVVAGTDNVVDSSGNQVIVTQTRLSSGSSNIKYLTVVPGATYSVTLSNFHDTTLVDWKTFDGTGVDSPAFAEFGYMTFGDSSRQKQAKYATFHFKRTETGFGDVLGSLEALNPSSCKTRVVWGFANDSGYAKYGTQFEAYRLRRNYIPSGTGDTFNYGESLITTKNRLRGSGVAMRLRIDSTPGHHLHMYGWSLNITGMSRV